MEKNKLLGSVFHRLTVVSGEKRDLRKSVLWECQCTCGGKTTAYAFDLRAGKVKSCGCLALEGVARTHGQSGKARSPEYSIWASMIQRCTNPNARNWGSYGGRGILVCARWFKFENFFSDMGPRLAGTTLEREDNSRGYSKDNCTWATRQAQVRNKRSNVWVAVDGTKMVLKDALQKIGRTKQAAYYHTKKGIPLQEVIDRWLQMKER